MSYLVGKDAKRLFIVGVLSFTPIYTRQHVGEKVTIWTSGETPLAVGSHFITTCGTRIIVFFIWPMKRIAEQDDESSRPLRRRTIQTTAVVWLPNHFIPSGTPRLPNTDLYSHIHKDIPKQPQSDIHTDIGEKAQSSQPALELVNLWKAQCVLLRFSRECRLHLHSCKANFLRLNLWSDCVAVASQAERQSAQRNSTRKEVVASEHSTDSLNV